MSSRHIGAKIKKSELRVFEFSISDYSTVAVLSKSLGRALNAIINSKRLSRQEKEQAVKDKHAAIYKINEVHTIDYD